MLRGASSPSELSELDALSELDELDELDASLLCFRFRSFECFLLSFLCLCLSFLCFELFFAFFSAYTISILPYELGCIRIHSLVKIAEALDTYFVFLVVLLVG